ncbi:acetoacetyl-CoA synthetase [Jatrophihabitans endophyticus]|uniref:Acetoacetyl-CoA synthetase n=1 Tax=Jatrophihabitans endophyticus TaxID=1206085 RepID=A0A1M5DE92_9ACTN|nr:acetoacetate--CoA ligase [Jatrophihabitans endophyticus]SHF65201.1 acetoacetyl-CoA synthetase [Jatrophihabitans endophyticus]
MTVEGELLWEPDAERIAGARITEFGRWLGANGGVTVGTYDEMWQWSTADLDAFWSAFARWYGVRWHTRPSAALADPTMPGARWFPDARLNYAEHALFPPVPVGDDDPAVVFEREDGLGRTLTWDQLRREVGAVRAALVTAGVGVGDRVAALLPNSPEALVAMLATVSLGAIWSSCSPDFGARAVADRFTQIEPVVLVAVDGYHYGGKRFDVRAAVTELRAQLPTLRATILVPYLDPDAALPDTLRWPDVLARPGELAFAPVPFDAPMWILYSSGTTGLPKPIVHGHGGILVEHAKQLALHLDLRAGDRFFWFSTTGWMMWNLLVSGLVVGATVVLFDGNPVHPGPDALWRLAERARVACFGVSAPYLQACQRAEVHPGRDFDLAALRSVGSTGAPLSPDGFAWVYEQVGRDLVLNSLSGGTDVCTAFVGGAPTLPVRAGEIPCRLLGCAVEAYDAAGRPVLDEVGELVVTAPMPSMPVGFWNDPDGSRLREAYFDVYPGVWRHGDWITVTGRGSCVIHGRSDATLNRGGVRMGTAEFYAVAEDVAGIADSLVVDTSGPTGTGQVLLFVVLADGATIETVREEVRRAIRAELSPRHVPDEVVAVAAIPRTLNGKKCEVPVKRVLAGVALADAVSPGALQNPAAMTFFAERGAQ